MPKTSPDAPSIAQQREYLRRQRNGYAIMEQERLRQLADLNYERNLPILDGLLAFAYQHRQPQPSSGLVELQRILMKQQERR